MQTTTYCNSLECPATGSGVMVSDKQCADDETWDQEAREFRIQLSCPFCRNAILVVQDYSKEA